MDVLTGTDFFTVEVLTLKRLMTYYVLFFIAAMQGRGLGVTSMLERVRLLGGTVTIDSKLHGGTTVYACIPLETHQAQYAGL